MALASSPMGPLLEYLGICNNGAAGTMGSPRANTGVNNAPFRIFLKEALQIFYEAENAKFKHSFLTRNLHRSFYNSRVRVR